MCNKFYIIFEKFDYFVNLKFQLISKTKILLILLLFLNSCVGLPGVDQEPKKRKLSKKLTSEYSIEDVEINIINLNKATEVDFDFYNQKKVKVLDNEIIKFANIYDYTYQYVLGTSDVIEINLTDSDDIDGSYIINTEGMILSLIHISEPTRPY